MISVSVAVLPVMSIESIEISGPYSLSSWSSPAAWVSSPVSPRLSSPLSTVSSSRHRAEPAGYRRRLPLGSAVAAERLGRGHRVGAERLGGAIAAGRRCGVRHRRDRARDRDAHRDDEEGNTPRTEVNVAHRRRRVLPWPQMAGRHTLVIGHLAICAVVVACTDIRDYQGQWHGARIGDGSALDVGVGSAATATLAIASIDENGLAGTLAIDGVMASSPIASLPGAEADALAGTTFTGSPLRVYFAFAGVDDGSGQALVLVALFPSRRVDVRVLRGCSGASCPPAGATQPGPPPIYGIFTLQPFVAPGM